MFLDKVLCDLIILLTSNRVFNITQLSEYIKKSRRIVYYNIQKLNDYLIKNNESIIENKKGVGVVLSENQKKLILQLIDNSKYYVNREERRLLITLLITTYPKKLNVEKMQELFMVSRNSILNDILEIKKNVVNFNSNIKIKTKSKGGYDFVGDELIKIQYIYFILKEIMDLKNQKIIGYVNDMYKDIDIVFSEDFSNSIYKTLNNIQISLGKTISQKEVKYICFSIPFLYIFSKNNVDTKELNILMDRLEYKILVENIKSIEEKYNIIFSQKCLLLITLILLCSSKISDIHSNSKDYSMLRDLSNDIIEKSNLELENKQMAIDTLTTYLKVLYFRKKYNIISNSNLDSFVNENKELYDLIKKITKNDIISFNDRDLKNILVYFLVFMKNKKKNILIVSAESSIIKQYIKKKIESSFNNINIVGLIDKYKLDNYSQYDIDLIITTEYDLQSKFNYIVISRNIDRDDMIKIFTELNN